MLKLPVCLRLLVGGSPSRPKGITANELTRVSNRGEGRTGLLCATGDRDGWAWGSEGGTRFNTGLKDAFRADSLASTWVECSPLNLRLSSVAACTNASSPAKPPIPPNEPGLPREDSPVTGERDGSALRRLGSVATEDLGVDDGPSESENDVDR